MNYTREEILENRKKWAADLRSNRYSQCRGTIYNGVGYCCLGVAAVGLGRKLMVGDPEAQWMDYNAVDQAIGITGCVSGVFVHANDHLCESFLQIADRVDALPPPEVP